MVNAERNKIIHNLFRSKFKSFKEMQDRAKLNIKGIDECEEKIALEIIKWGKANPKTL